MVLRGIVLLLLFLSTVFAFKIEDVSVLENNTKIWIKFSKDIDIRNDFKSNIEIENLKIAKFVPNNNELILLIDGNPSVAKSYTIKLYTNLKSADGERLDGHIVVKKEITFKELEPKVEFSDTRVLMPKGKDAYIPIKVTNAKAIIVTAYELYEKNIPYFLQENTLTDRDSTKRFGRYLWQKRVVLNDLIPNKETTFNLDVSKLQKITNGSLVRLTLTIDMKDSVYGCDETKISTIKKFQNKESESVDESSGWDGFEDDHDNRYTEGPCDEEYYRHSPNTIAEKNIYKTNIAIIAKRDMTDNTLYLYTSFLDSAKKVSGAKIEVYNYQNQLLSTAKSDKRGFAKLKLKGKPFYIKVTKGSDKSYLKISDAKAINVSTFDVGGKSLDNTFDGYIYGERSIWRPGDDIYLTFVLQDRYKKLPKNHPVIMKLFAPNGDLVEEKVNKNPVGPFYTFSFKTDIDDETGKYRAVAMVGDNTFSKDIAIETIMPNRLKIDVTPSSKHIMENKELNITVKSRWLYGATAEHLRVHMDVSFSPRKTKFNSFVDYIFEDVIRKIEFYDTKKTLYDDFLNDKGEKSFSGYKPKVDEYSSGFLNLILTTYVFEKEGRFSTNIQRFDYFPYDNYVGLKVPKGDKTRGMLLTDKDHKVDMVVLDSYGKPVEDKEIEFNFYKIEWKWWWDKTADKKENFISSRSYSSDKVEVVKTDKSGKASASIRVDYPQWGRYLVRACLKSDGHCSSKIVYIDWPGWAGRAVEQNNKGVARINLLSNKKSYKVGEIATVTLPEYKDAKVLVTLSNGLKIFKQYTLDDKKESFKVKITKQMLPNLYVDVMMIQPHKSLLNNDRPIRMLGLLSLKVDAPSQHIHPILSTPKEVEPQKPFEIKVSQKGEGEFYYTLAVVDEGLLGITSFKTPGLYRYFYKKYAYSIKSWDLYDLVVGGYSHNVQRLLAIGGGSSASDESDLQKSKKRRFKPVVEFLGSFKLDKNQTKTHKVTLPEYLGEVRVMLVASDGKGAFGKASSDIKVKKPLLIFPTIPRAVNIEEEFSIPVELFVTDKNITKAELSISVDSNSLEVLDGNCSVDIKSDKVSKFRLKAKQKVGQAKITIVAKSKNYTTSKSVYLDISVANPFTCTTRFIELKGRKTLINIPYGITGSNKTTMELSSLPPFSLQKRLNYLIRYPHGCLEQTTSSVFPQLYLTDLVELDKKRLKKIKENINRAISKLERFQDSEGNFRYWQGEDSYSDWASIYATNFLLEAKAKGYYVKEDFLQRAIKEQIKASKSDFAQLDSENKIEAYRLYVLALAKKPNISAMNRLKERLKAKPETVSNWSLAMAFKMVGLKSSAKELMDIKSFKDEYDLVRDTTFGSSLRDRAFVMIAALKLNEYDFVQKLSKEIADMLSSDREYATNSVAFALMAMSQKRVDSDGIKVSYKVGDKESLIDSKKSLILKELDFSQSSDTVWQIENLNKNSTNLTITNCGSKKPTKDKVRAEGLDLTVSYHDDNTTLDISKLKLGKMFKAKIKVENKTDKTISNIALTFKVPTGWEVINDRLSSQDIKGVENIDIKDNNIYIYFALAKKSQKEFEFKLISTYSGKFYLPSVVAKSMYDANILATTKSREIVVEP